MLTLNKMHWELGLKPSLDHQVAELSLVQSTMTTIFTVHHYRFPTTGNVVGWNSGTASDVLSISLDPGMEMRFVYRCVDGVTESSIRLDRNCV